MTNTEAFEVFKEMRWGNDESISCPCCGVVAEHAFRKDRRQWMCSDCGHTFSVTAGTISEKRRSSYEERLVFMKDLTPGDFATVKRQCVLLGEELGPEEWLTQLELEVKAKARDTATDAEKER